MSTLSTYCGLRPKAKDLGITQVVVVLVGFFVSKTHATSLYLFALLLYFQFVDLPTYLYQYTYLPTYLPMTTHQPIYPYQLTSTYLSTYIDTPTHLFLLTNTYQPIPTHVNLPSSTYLPLPIPKYQYRIAADPGAGIGLIYSYKTGYFSINIKV